MRENIFFPNMLGRVSQYRCTDYLDHETGRPLGLLLADRRVRALRIVRPVKRPEAEE